MWQWLASRHVTLLKLVAEVRTASSHSQLGTKPLNSVTRHQPHGLGGGGESGLRLTPQPEPWLKPTLQPETLQQRAQWRVPRSDPQIHAKCVF